MLASVREQRARKQQAVSDRLADCTQRLHRTTGLLQFGVEVLKEADPTAFLLASLSTISTNWKRSCYILSIKDVAMIIKSCKCHYFVL